MTNCIPTIMQLSRFISDSDEAVYVVNALFSQVIEALMDLNGVDIDTISVKLTNGDSMDVGGGKDDQYKCHVRTNGKLYDLINPRVPRNVHDVVTIMMDQEGSTYPKCCIVSREMVLMAIETFCSSGLMDPRLIWDDTLEYDPL